MFLSKILILTFFISLNSFAQLEVVNQGSLISASKINEMIMKINTLEAKLSLSRKVCEWKFSDPSSATTECQGSRNCTIRYSSCSGTIASTTNNADYTLTIENGTFGSGKVSCFVGARDATNAPQVNVFGNTSENGLGGGSFSFIGWNGSNRRYLKGDITCLGTFP